MCWSGEASAVLAAIGIAGTAYAAYKKEPTVIWIGLGYFSLMEMLQAFTYTVIDQCSVPSNQIATYLGYLHIAFQPFFINAASLHFVQNGLVKKIQPLVYTLCFVATIMMLIQVYPFTWATACEQGVRPICGPQVCSVSGSWHIAWMMPRKEIAIGIPWYLVVGFLLPFLYGSWRFTVYHILLGPLLAYATTQDLNEWPAVWCLLSIGFLLIVVKTPVRGLLYVRKWWFWELPKSLRDA